MASSSAGSTFPKWQIAVAIGATAGIGLGYWYLRQQSLKSKKPNLSSTSKNTVSLDDTTQESVGPQTPLQQAQKHKTEGKILLILIFVFIIILLIRK